MRESDVTLEHRLTSHLIVACLLKHCEQKCEREADVSSIVRAGYVCMPRGACRAVRLAPPVRTESDQPALLRLLRTKVVC